MERLFFVLLNVRLNLFVTHIFMDLTLNASRARNKSITDFVSAQRPFGMSRALVTLWTTLKMFVHFVSHSLTRTHSFKSISNCGVAIVSKWTLALAYASGTIVPTESYNTVAPFARTAPVIPYQLAECDMWAEFRTKSAWHGTVTFDINERFGRYEFSWYSRNLHAKPNGFVSVKRPFHMKFIQPNECHETWKRKRERNKESERICERQMANASIPFRWSNKIRKFLPQMAIGIGCACGRFIVYLQLHKVAHNSKMSSTQ